MKKKQNTKRIGLQKVRISRLSDMGTIVGGSGYCNHEEENQTTIMTNPLTKVAGLSAGCTDRPTQRTCFGL